jgi:hypothetical protein
MCFLMTEMNYMRPNQGLAQYSVPDNSVKTYFDVVIFEVNRGSDIHLNFPQCLLMKPLTGKLIYQF